MSIFWGPAVLIVAPQGSKTHPDENTRRMGW